MKHCLFYLILLILPLSLIGQQVKINHVNNGVIYHITISSDAFLFDHADYAIFIPDDIEKIKGVFIHQHGCTMEGMGASTAYDIQYQALAKKWGLAIVSPDIYPKQGRSCADWRDTESGSGPALIEVLNRIADVSKIEELKIAPWLLWGHSGGGYWTLSMMKNYPERIMAVFSYSPAFDPKWDYPAATAKIPIIIRHAGQGDLAMCWETALNSFAKLRSMNGLASIAYNPDQNHNLSFVRYMAIPFYEAVLKQRLTDKTGVMKDMDNSLAWLADPVTNNIYKADSFKGNISAMCWLPDSITATLWREYVITGTIVDHTPPSAPYNLRVDDFIGNVAILKWDVDADIESGVKYFRIRIGDNRQERFPLQEDFQRFDTNGDNTIPIFISELRFELPRPGRQVNELKVSISTVNHFLKESRPTTILVKWEY